MKVVYAERARRDIGDIYDAISKQSLDAAQRVEDFICAACDGHTDFPYATAATDELNVRRLPLVRYPYTIFYRIRTDVECIEIARVIHGARIKDLGALPEDE